jgi:hypothetical protein
VVDKVVGKLICAENWSKVEPILRLKRYFRDGFDEAELLSMQLNRFLLVFR